MRGRTVSMRRDRCVRLTAIGLGLAVGVLATRANATSEADLCAPNADPCVVSTVITATNGSEFNLGNRELRINSGGAIDVGSGTMTIRARSLSMLTGSFLRARPTSSSAAGGIVSVVVEQANIVGTIDASGAPGGQVVITASDLVTVSGSVAARATSSLEVGGSIDITAGDANITGSLLAFGGNFEGLGGDISVTSTGSITVSGTLDATGADGGTIDLDAGPGEGNAGDLTIAPSAILKVDATAAGNFGGTIDLAAQGNNVDSGRVTADGQLSGSGRTGGEDTGGGDGGCVSISASGDIRMLQAASTYNVNAGGPDGSGGEIELSTISGAIEVRGTLTALSPGDQGSGGSVSIDSTLEAIVAGPMAASGGDGGGGEITVASTSSGVTLEKTASATVAATAAGTGGTICLESGFGNGSELRSVVVEGDLNADGGVGGGIDISAGSEVRIDAASVLTATALVDRGGAISIAVDDGPALIDGPITAAGGRPSGAGGVIAIDASQRIVSNGQLDARGQATGGSIGLSSGGAIDVRRAALASSASAGGGEIEIVSQGQVLISAALNTDGTSAAGLNTLTGCEVTICGMDAAACGSGAVGMLTSLGPNGVNRIVGRDASFMLGTMRADGDTGRNELVYNGAIESEPLVLGSAIPEATLVVDPRVIDCAPPTPGDVNGDHIVADVDREFLAEEIFDDDGDSVDTVKGGAFAGSPGADANNDKRITAADLVAISKLLGN
jgi:filamentous hemagglutinin